VKANDCAVLLMRIACNLPDTRRARNLVVGIPARHRAAAPLLCCSRPAGAPPSAAGEGGVAGGRAGGGA